MLGLRANLPRKQAKPCVSHNAFAAPGAPADCSLLTFCSPQPLALHLHTPVAAKFLVTVGSEVFETLLIT